MFSDAVLTQNPFLKKILDAQKESGTSGIQLAQPSKSKATTNLATRKKAEDAKPIDPKKMKEVIKKPEVIPGQPAKPQTATQFAKTKPTKKQVKEFLTEKIDRLNNAESESDDE